ncbi:hypothetical protein [Stenotrophomonas maltophilia]|uniref:hypothetical protein n=1 Tax=Stenotrophomonas maltophilia TaxID=40324 RepID=UPI000AC82059|nr:hypothetical protein [Stenotrophomonas maltophilia]MBH1465326.1 hypothetical protein [Stenotrophomonas maltophilia]MBH1613014.1 hypothetical protein [Stenotrophomonas maltophilia]MBN5167286.1 hypothetical protein [Stenotrophomonas maltophilia]
MTNKPTPTSGGAWRVIDGALVNEAQPSLAPHQITPKVATEPPKATRQRTTTTTPTEE